MYLVRVPPQSPVLPDMVVLILTNFQIHVYLTLSLFQHHNHRLISVTGAPGTIPAASIPLKVKEFQDKRWGIVYEEVPFQELSKHRKIKSSSKPSVYVFSKNFGFTEDFIQNQQQLK